MTNKTRQILILGFVLCLLAMGTTLSALYITSTKGDDLKAQLVIVKTEAAKEQYRQNTERIIEKSKSDRADLASYFIRETDTISLINTLEARAKANRLLIETTQLAIEPGKDGAPSLLKIGWQFSGTYVEVMRYLELLESLPYHKTIVSTALEKDLQGNLWDAGVIMHLTIQNEK